MQAGNIVAVEGTVELAQPIIDRAARTDGSSPVSDQALLAAAQGQRQLLLFTEGGDTPVAVGVLGQGELDLVVDPPVRGRGVGTTALHSLLERSGPDADLLAWAHGENPAATALLSGAKFRPVRSLFRMALDPALLPTATTDPASVAFPAGFDLRTFDAELPADASAWVAVNARAFADHPEQGRVTLADFALMRAEPWFDPSDLFLLSDPEGDGLAGFTWVKTLHDGDATETELYAIGVDPAHAGHGLGRALLDVTLARMAQHAPARVTLYVDGENERAVRMYEAAGFTIDTRSTQWRGPARPQVSE
ncbi:MAG: mycothiol synthase [Leucobacter sp.]|nr:mycothiol synthase [Leucobacter sp.]